MSNGWRSCPICAKPDVPPWEATCGLCWHAMNADMRRRLLRAWRRRVIDYGHYSETLAETLTWAVETIRPTDVTPREDTWSG